MLVVPTWDRTSCMTHRVQRLLTYTLVMLISIKSSVTVISKCRAAPGSAEVWILFSRRMVPSSKIVARAEVTLCGLVFWSIIASIASLVISRGMVFSVLTMIFLLIVVYSGEYSGFALVFVLRTLVKP